MKLKIINSNSKGNAYILENDQEALLIECGVRFDLINKALNFNRRKVVGCLVTHEHLDHCKAVQEVLEGCIDVYASLGTHDKMGTADHHRSHVIVPGKEFQIGEFRIKAFDVKHDCAQPVGYLIQHPETGNILFLTDSYYVEYTFKGLNQVIIEANYCQQILDQRVRDSASPKFLRDRVIESHMSLATCKETLQANDLSAVNNIVLIHLSDGNSDARRFKHEVQEQTGKTVWVSEAGMEIDLNLSPF